MKKYSKLIKFLMLSFVTIGVCLYALEWHRVYKENILNQTIITTYISEIKTAEFKNYILENPHSVIYFGITNNDDCRKFEGEFKNYLIKKNLTQTIIYVNLNGIYDEDISKIFDKVYNNETLRKQGLYLNSVPAVAIYDHSKLIDFVSSKNLTTKMVDKMLSKYNYLGE